MDMDPLTQLSLAWSNPDKTIAEQLKLTCESLAAVIPKANRVSLWRFNEAKSSIQCIALLDEDQFSLPENVYLTEEDYGNYFSAILQNDFVLASEARTHPDTSCFTEGYFKEKDIYSLLDYVLNKDFTPFGIICCESAGETVQWDDEDLDNLKRAARIVSVFSYVQTL